MRSTKFQWFVLNIVNNPNNGILFAFSLFSAFSGCLSLIGPICTTKIRAFGTHFHGEFTSLQKTATLLTDLIKSTRKYESSGVDFFFCVAVAVIFFFLLQL